MPIASEPLFPTPMLIETIADRDVGRARLCATLMAAAGEHSGGSAWTAQSLEAGSADLLACLHPVERRAASLAARMTVDTRAAGRPVNWQTRPGAHVARSGEQIVLAPCYDAFWSAIYVADDGSDGSSSDEGGGALIFDDPRLPMTMMEMPDLRLRLSPGRTAEVYAPDVAMRPATGTLLVFPGWLRATFRPHRQRGTRIIVTVALVAPL